MRKIFLLIAVMLSCLVGVGATGWPQDSVRKSLDYLYAQLQLLGGTNVIGSISVTGDVLGITNDPADMSYTITLTTNAIHIAISPLFIERSDVFVGAVTGTYDNIQLVDGSVVSNALAESLWASLHSVFTTPDEVVSPSAMTNAITTSLTAVSNQFLRVVEISPGVWQHKLPGEE